MCAENVVGAHECQQRQEKYIGSPGAGDTGCDHMSDVDAGYHTHAPWRSCASVQKNQDCFTRLAIKVYY